MLDGVIDGTQMLVVQPMAAAIGDCTKANIVAPFSMDLNDNGITVSNALGTSAPHSDDGGLPHAKRLWRRFSD